MEDLFRSLSNYKSKKRSKVEILENAQSIFDGRRQIVMAFEQNIFPLPQQPKDEKYAFDILL